jgi:hypothetical protein
MKMEYFPDYLLEREPMSYNFSRVDDNQKIIVKTFRQLGYEVVHTHTLGSGFPDIIICSPKGRMELVEIKDGLNPPSKQKLTVHEEKFHAIWPRKVYIINSIEAVLKMHEEIK